MRIDSLGRSIPGGGGTIRGGGAGVFRIGDEHRSDAPRQAAPLRAAPTLDALIALQAVEETPIEKRRRALKRGRGLLDSLDDLKLAMVDGRSDPSSLIALSRRLSERGESSGDAGLDDALSAIELRAGVELAKRGR